MNIFKVAPEGVATGIDTGADGALEADAQVVPIHMIFQVGHRLKLPSACFAGKLSPTVDSRHMVIVVDGGHEQLAEPAFTHLIGCRVGPSLVEVHINHLLPTDVTGDAFPMDPGHMLFQQSWALKR